MHVRERGLHTNTHTSNKMSGNKDFKFSLLVHILQSQVTARKRTRRPRDQETTTTTTTPIDNSNTTYPGSLTLQSGCCLQALYRRKSRTRLVSLLLLLSKMPPRCASSTKGASGRAGPLQPGLKPDENRPDTLLSWGV